jgi:hypothetical protein
MSSWNLWKNMFRLKNEMRWDSIFSFFRENYDSYMYLKDIKWNGGTYSNYLMGNYMISFSQFSGLWFHFTFVSTFHRNFLPVKIKWKCKSDWNVMKSWLVEITEDESILCIFKCGYNFGWLKLNMYRYPICIIIFGGPRYKSVILNILNNVNM